MGYHAWLLVPVIIVFLGPLPAAAQDDPEIGQPMPFRILINGSDRSQPEFLYLISATLNFTLPPQKGLIRGGVATVDGTFSWTYGMRQGCKLSRGTARGSGKLKANAIVNAQSGTFGVVLIWPDLATEQFEMKCPNNFPQFIAGPSPLGAQVLVPLEAGEPKAFIDNTPSQGPWKLRTPCSLHEYAPIPVKPVTTSEAWPLNKIDSSKTVADLNRIEQSLHNSPVPSDAVGGAVVGLTLPGYVNIENGADPGFPRPNLEMKGTKSGSCFGVREINVGLAAANIFIAQEIANDVCQREAVVPHELEHFNRMKKHTSEFVQNATNQVKALVDFIPSLAQPIYAGSADAKELIDQLNLVVYSRIPFLLVSEDAAKEQADWDFADRDRVIAKCRNWPRSP